MAWLFGGGGFLGDHWLHWGRVVSHQPRVFIKYLTIATIALIIHQPIAWSSYISRRIFFSQLITYLLPCNRRLRYSATNSPLLSAASFAGGNEDQRTSVVVAVALVRLRHRLLRASSNQNAASDLQL